MAKTMGWLWLAAFGLWVVYFYGMVEGLPDRLAVHFDVNGIPNGFQGKGDFLRAFPLFAFITNGIPALLYFLLEKIPLGAIHLPGKALWLAQPGGRAGMFERLRLVLSLIGLFSNFVFFLTIHVIAQANGKAVWLNVPVNGVMLGIGGVLFFLLGAVLVLARPPESTK